MGDPLAQWVDLSLIEELVYTSKSADTNNEKKRITLMSFFNTFFSIVFKSSSESHSPGMISGLIIFCFDHFWAGLGESPMVSARPHLAPVIMVSKCQCKYEECLLSSFSADTDFPLDQGAAGCGPVVDLSAEATSEGLVRGAAGRGEI